MYDHSATFDANGVWDNYQAHFTFKCRWVVGYFHV